MTLECAKQKLQQYGQEHLLKYFDTLSETQKEALLQQIEETDFSVLNKIGSNEKESSTGTIISFDFVFDAKNASDSHL